MTPTITIDTGEDDIPETPTTYSLRGILGLVYVKRRWCSGRLDRTESASSGASIAHQLKIKFV